MEGIELSNAGRVLLRCPLGDLTRNLPSNWKELLGSDTLTCVAHGLVMEEVKANT